MHQSDYPSPASSDGARTRPVSSMARVCALLLIPVVALAPPVPSIDGGGATAAESPRYLRGIDTRDYRHGNGGDSSLADLVSSLRSTTSNPDAVVDEMGDLKHEIEPVVALTIEDGPGGGSERKLQRLEPKWYVSWYEGKCVQSCRPTSKNRHCAGNARWDQLLFDTAEICCLLNLVWQPIEDCVGADEGGPDDINSITALNNNGNDGVDENGCPAEYSHLSDYVSFDMATIYITETKGNVYRCKDGPLFQYCNIFPPDWSRTSYGGGSVHTTDSLGWELMGDCDGNPVALAAPEADPEFAWPPYTEILVDPPPTVIVEANPVSPADVGFGLDPLSDGEVSPVSPADAGLSLDPPHDVPLSIDLPGLSVVAPEASLTKEGSDGGDGKKPAKGGPPDYGVGSSGPGTSGPETEGASSPPKSKPASGKPFRPLRPKKPPTQGTESFSSASGGGGSDAADTGSGVGKKPAKPKPAKPKPAKPNPPLNGDQGEGSDIEEDSTTGDSVRPTPDQLGKPGRPYKPKPKPMVQVQHAPDPIDKDEGDTLIEKDGMRCYRSGKRCDSDAEIFACCTQCINSICI